MVIQGVRRYRCWKGSGEENEVEVLYLTIRSMRIFEPVLCFLNGLHDELVALNNRSPRIQIVGIKRNVHSLAPVDCQIVFQTTSFRWFHLNPRTTEAGWTFE
jgi:hypothetical protein